MRIVIYWEQSAWGGVDTHLLSLLNSWPAPGDEIILIYNSGNQGFLRIRDEIRFPGRIRFEKIHSFSYNECKRRLSNGLLKLLVPFVYFFQPLLMFCMCLRFYFLFKRKKDIDIVFSDNGGYPGGHGCIAAVMGAKWAGIPGKIMMIHHAASKTNVWTSNYERLLDRYLSACADTIICPSFATKKSIMDYRYFNEENVKMAVIPNGISLQERSETSFTFFEPGHAEKKKMVLVGRIEPYKGHEDVIQAVSLLPNHVQEQMVLYFIGKGEDDYVDRLKRMIDDLQLTGIIFFTGYIRGNPVDVIRYFDLLISATRSFEGFGLSIAEALYAKVPVVATGVGAIPEMFENIVQIVAASDANELKNAFEDFFRDRAKWEQMALRGHDRIREFSLNMAPSFYSEFFFLCGGGKRKAN